jgi:glycerophosphoryl diester phosphodiesterase
MVTVIAHRGASAYALENTAPALELALEQGADVLEVDIRLTADGVPVLLHDETLRRTTGDERPIAAVTRDELARLPDPVRPLLLEDAFEHLGGRARFLLDLKDPRTELVDAVVACVRRARVAEDVRIQAFGRPGLRLVRRAHPTIALAQLYPALMPSAFVRRDLGRAERLVAAIGPHGDTVDAALVQAAHRRGLRVQPWTVNDPAEMDRLVALGVDGLITDAPDLALAATRVPALVAA